MTSRFLIGLQVIGFLAYNNNIFAQSLSFKEPTKQFFKLKIDNDVLVFREHTDRYYTSGLKLNYSFEYNPSHSGFIFNIFPKLKDATNYYGYSVATNMYTPSTVRETAVQGDRPYAGWAYFGLTNISNNPKTSTRFTSEYSLGAIGPITQQEYIQRTVHKIASRPKPLGWKDQIANDIALNFNFIGEKRFGKLSDNMALIGIVETNIGTVSNYMGVGGMVRLGYFEDYFKNVTPISNHQNWQIFVFARPMVRIVADNALLQGGIFTYRKSPYVIRKDDLKRYYMETEFGYGLSFKNFNFTYSQNLRTPEFLGAKNMFWGSVALSYGL